MMNARCHLIAPGFVLGTEDECEYRKVVASDKDDVHVRYTAGVYQVVSGDSGGGRAGIRVITMNTGQHREMLDEIMRRFSFVPDHNLMLVRKNQTLSGSPQRRSGGCPEVVKKHKPDVMVVQGDTVSCFAGALAAFYNKVPVAHVEAGLRASTRTRRIRRK